MALTRMGVTQIRYSSPAGIRGESFLVYPNHDLPAPPYEAARREMQSRDWTGLGGDHRHRRALLDK